MCMSVCYAAAGAKAYKDSKLCLMMLSNLLHDRYAKQTGISFSSIYPVSSSKRSGSRTQRTLAIAQSTNHAGGAPLAALFQLFTSSTSLTSHPSQPSYFSFYRAASPSRPSSARSGRGSASTSPSL